MATATRLNPTPAQNANGPAVPRLAASYVVHEDLFRRLITIERKRTERTKHPFLLMLLEGASPHVPGKADNALDLAIAALLPTIRETDVCGWYKERHSLGVMFTGIESDDRDSALSNILKRATAKLRSQLTPAQFAHITISLYCFPDDWGQSGTGGPGNGALYPDLSASDNEKWLMLRVKRTIDILLSGLLLVILAPLLALIAAAIKLTSRGPVLFKQARVGQYGQSFTFLKFRSMQVNNDSSCHEEYVKQLIAGRAERMALRGNGESVYKLVADSRITPIGKLLRRTSLDELPQLLNVFRGEMSLVGPRPPIPYELAAYQTWHRRRLLNTKPGITGLWQVNGRNRVSFDDMVRMDLQYAAAWSPWLDFKILLRTPAAVIKGAY